MLFLLTLLTWLLLSLLTVDSMLTALLMLAVGTLLTLMLTLGSSLLTAP